MLSLFYCVFTTYFLYYISLFFHSLFISFYYVFYTNVLLFHSLFSNTSLLPTLSLSYFFYIFIHHFFTINLFFIISSFSIRHSSLPYYQSFLHPIFLFSIFIHLFFANNSFFIISSFFHSPFIIFYDLPISYQLSPFFF